MTSGTTIPDSITANLTIAGVSSGDIEFDDTGLATGDPLRFVLRSLPSTATTGMYDWDMDITLNYTGSSETYTFEGQHAIVNRSDSEFGSGWWLDGLSRLYIETDGALLVGGDGSTYWFEDDSGTYLPAEGDFSYSTLESVTGGYELTDKWGNEWTYDSDGLLTGIQRLSNTVESLTFEYDNIDRVTTITDEFDREYTFDYHETTLKLELVNDFFGRESHLTHTGDELTEIEVTDVTFTGYAAPVWEFGYTTVGGDKLLTSVTDPADEVVTFVYDSDSRRLSKVQNADHTTQDPSEWELYPTISQGLAVASSGNTVLKVANMDTRFVDELNNTFDFTTDRFGNLTTFTDALDNTTTYDVDDSGLVYRITGADPDGAGSQTAPVTKFGYDDDGNWVITVNPDNTEVELEYDATLNLVTKIWNELDDFQTFEYFTDGDLKSWTDAEGNKWTYTYDSHGNLLTETSPDPDGAGSQTAITTTYEYDTTYYYRLTEITWADNNTQTFTYTTRDQLASATDELGKVTSYTYDPLGRLLTVTLPDPDGAGSQTSPVYTWAYGSNLQVSSETDPLGNVTSYTYDEVGRLTKITLPDPDDTGSLTAPEIEYEYNFLGLLTNATYPQFDNASIDYTYNANGQVTEVSGPLTNQDTDYEYDDLGRLTKVTDASGREISYTYDARSRLESVIDHDPDGAGPLSGPTTEFEYDDAGQLTSVTDALGRETTYTYLDNGWLEKWTRPDPDGSGPASAPVNEYQYDTLGRMIKHIDPAGRETTTDYNSRHLVTKVTSPDPDGDGPSNPLLPTETEYDYDAAGRLTEITALMDRVTEYSYDNLGRLLTLTLPDPDGAGSKTSPEYSWTYDAVGNVLTETDPLSGETTYAYDDLHRVTSITLPDPDGAGSQTSPVWSYEYNDRMLLDTLTNPMSEDTTYGYDAAGRRTTVTDPLSNVTTFAYDLLDRVISVTRPDPDGAGSQTAAVTEYTYDDYSRLTEIEDANNGTITNTYDVVGQLIRLEDQSGNETHWTYDNLGRMTMETDELGNTRSFYYNEIDRLIRKMDREGRTTLYGYHGYTESEIWYEFSGSPPVADIDTTTQGTTGTDEVQTVTLDNTTSGTFMLGFDGQTTAPLDYDATAAEVETALEALPAIDDVTVTKASGTWTITFGGDQAGTNVSTLQGAVALDNDGTKLRTISRTYNEAFFLIEADDDAGGSYDFTVDALGRVTQTEENHSGLAIDITLTYDYDANGNRTEMAVELWDFFSGTKDDYKNTYTYDALNRLTGLTQDAQSGGHAVADKHIEYAWNALGQMTSIDRFENTTGTNPALRTVMTYDAAGRLTGMDHQDIDSGGTATSLNDYDFTYDDAGRLTQIDSTEDGVSDFTYDALGQLTDADHASGRTDESYTFDSTGNRTGGDYVVTSKNRTSESTGYEYEYDLEGNRTKRTDTSDDSYELYEYDHRNRLTSVEFYNSSDVLTKSIEYTYDVFNRMVKRKLDANGSGSGGISYTYWAAFDGIHATLEFDGTAITDMTHRYLWGQLADDLLAAEEVTSTTSEGDVLWALSDQVGTIRDIGKWDSTNSEFVIANHRVYNSFGELESESDDTVDLAFGFTGKWTDEETGYTHHLNRWFDPAIGKWISEDPIGFAGGDTNISRYVANRATSMIDSNGLWGQGGGQGSRNPPGSTGAGSGDQENDPSDRGTDALKQDAQSAPSEQSNEEKLKKILTDHNFHNIEHENDTPNEAAGYDCDDFCYDAFKAIEEGLSGEEDVEITVVLYDLVGREKPKTILDVDPPTFDLPEHIILKVRIGSEKFYVDASSKLPGAVGSVQDYSTAAEFLQKFHQPNVHEATPTEEYDTPDGFYKKHTSEPHPNTRPPELQEKIDSITGRKIR